MSSKSIAEHNKTHYDSVTDAWLFILGNNLHYGYFKSGDMDLDSATACLIEVLAGMAQINENSKILDVGCGTGEPALYLHHKYNCRVTGITNSERGVELARNASKKKGCSEMVLFQLVDVLDNDFPSDEFDFVWQMESSHLIRDKTKLFSENFRVLKNTGTMLLCDLFLKKDFTVVDMYRYRRELGILEKSFGKVKLVTFENYTQEIQEAGFSNIDVVDISEGVYPTFGYWKSNILQNRKNILKYFNDDEVDSFLLSCEILDTFYKDAILGYGLVKAEKVEQRKR